MPESVKIFKQIEDDEWLTLKEVCKMLRVSRSTVDRLVAARRLTILRPSPHRTLYSKQSLAEHLAAMLKQREPVMAD